MITFINNKLFYKGTTDAPIYKFFRSNTPINGLITKPTGKRNIDIYISGKYEIFWKDILNEKKYYLIEI